MQGATSGEASIEIAAPPAQIYEMISDVTRMGEWSPECRRCEWLEGGEPKVGATFRGHNRNGPARWSTTAKVVGAEPGTEFAFTTIVRGRESTRWRYSLRPSASGTTLTESYEFVWAPIYLQIADVLMRRDKQLHKGLRQTLGRIKGAAESAAT